MSKKSISKVVALRPAGAEHRGTRLGRFVGYAHEQGPLVDYPENPHGPLPVRSLVPLTESSVACAIAEGRDVLLTFDAEHSDRPIVLGMLEPAHTPSDPLTVPPIEVSVDGRRVELEAHDELVLRCGSASITLRRNGRVVIRGTYVETASEGVNRIKGGSVRIN